MSDDLMFYVLVFCEDGGTFTLNSGLSLEEAVEIRDEFNKSEDNPSDHAYVVLEEMQSLSHPSPTETKAALERAINASYAGDVPDLARGVLFNLEMDGWRLVRQDTGER